MSEEKTEKRLSIVKIYTKDLSFESPQSPNVFRGETWSPVTNLNLRSAHTALDDNFHEVVLTITVEAKEKDDDKTLFLVELSQAGLFEIVGYDEKEFGVLAGSFCALSKARLRLVSSSSLTHGVAWNESACLSQTHLLEV